MNKTTYKIIRRKKKYNIQVNGKKVLSKLWFDNIFPPSNGYWIVQLGKRNNYLKEDGTLLSKRWYKYVWDINKTGIGVVTLEKNKNIVIGDLKYNFIKEDGTLLLKRWVDYVYWSCDSLVRVYLKRKYNFLNVSTGKFISKRWYTYANEFDKRNIVKIEKTHKTNFIDKNGKVLFKKWFDSASSFSNNIIKVNLNNKVNYVSSDGKLLFKEWFLDGNDFYCTINDKLKSDVIINKEYYTLYVNGNIELV